VSSVGSFFSYVNDARSHEPETRQTLNGLSNLLLENFKVTYCVNTILKYIGLLQLRHYTVIYVCLCAHASSFLCSARALSHPYSARRSRYCHARL